ncbi:hypothetical protein H2201_001983 [Coniosporium apollinis]|uniref:Uncharacterized protein n=1 Tax=Coniosporium apollinis TaxID=61459 RepID=A0ABQ9P070_9PEZI|nr:hypothetical protein H2201_001983 [Coniosporium apollinis]
MPAPPSQWQGAEESMRNWLMAKAEEEKRKQEEERTRQEGLRLEQRKIEQTMLRDSMSGGVPPHLVPMIFAGIGGGNLANISIDWLQQYAAQLQAAQQQQVIVQSQSSPDSRRDQRMIGQPQPSVAYRNTGAAFSTTTATRRSILSFFVLCGYYVANQQGESIAASWSDWCTDVRSEAAASFSTSTVDDKRYADTAAALGASGTLITAQSVHASARAHCFIAVHILSPLGASGIPSRIEQQSPGHPVS